MDDVVRAAGQVLAAAAPARSRRTEGRRARRAGPRGARRSGAARNGLTTATRRTLATALRPRLGRVSSDRRAGRGPRRRGRLRGRAQAAAADEERLRVPRARARRPERQHRGARLERRRPARRAVRRGRRGARARPGRALPRPAAARRALDRARAGRPTRRASRRRCAATPTSWTASSTSSPPRSRTRAWRDGRAHPRRRGDPPAAARAAGGPDGHHDYAGGLLEHTVGVATICRELCQLHPRLRADLLLAAALLHDVGRTVELEPGPGFRADLRGAPARPRPPRAAADRGARRARSTRPPAPSSCTPSPPTTTPARRRRPRRPSSTTRTSSTRSPRRGRSRHLARLDRGSARARRERVVGRLRLPRRARPAARLSLPTVMAITTPLGLVAIGVLVAVRGEPLPATSFVLWARARGRARRDRASPRSTRGSPSAGWASSRRSRRRRR